MSDVVVQVITPAGTINPVAPPPTPYDLLTLAEAKTFLGITDTSRDAQLQLWLSMSSAMVAEMCNRVFAKEKVKETWFCLASSSLYLTRWPVKATDIVSVTDNGVTLSSADYLLEETKGHLYRASGWATPVEIVYTGGYMCPSEVPDDLKYAASLLVQEQRAMALIASVSGVRMLSHKHARVMFYDPNRVQQRGGVGTAAQQQAKSLLANYTRFWV
jgi:hypothetical protein